MVHLYEMVIVIEGLRVNKKKNYAPKVIFLQCLGNDLLSICLGSHEDYQPRVLAKIWYSARMHLKTSSETVFPPTSWF